MSVHRNVCRPPYLHSYLNAIRQHPTVNCPKATGSKKVAGRKVVRGIC